MNDRESYPEEDMMSQEDQEQVMQEEEEEQPKLRILKNKKKKRPVSDKRRKQLAKARATKARKAMERKLMKQHASKKKEEEQNLKHRQAAEDRLADIIEQKVTQAFEQYLGLGQRRNQTMLQRFKHGRFLVNQRLHPLLWITPFCSSNNSLSSLSLIHI